jgi:hypothetical protein
MAGGGSFTSDQKTAHAIADGQLVTGPCRVTSIQAKGNASGSVILHDNASAGSGTAHTFLFGTEGLEVFIPGSGIRMKNGCHLTLSGSGSCTITFN